MLQLRSILCPLASSQVKITAAIILNHCLPDGCGRAELVLEPLDSVTRLQLGLVVLLGLGVLVYMELTTSQY